MSMSISSNDPSNNAAPGYTGANDTANQQASVAQFQQQVGAAQDQGSHGLAGDEKSWQTKEAARTGNEDDACRGINDLSSGNYAGAYEAVKKGTASGDLSADQGKDLKAAITNGVDQDGAAAAKAATNWAKKETEATGGANDANKVGEDITEGKYDDASSLLANAQAKNQISANDANTIQKYIEDNKGLDTVNAGGSVS